MTEYDVPRKVMLVEVPQRGIGWTIIRVLDLIGLLIMLIPTMLLIGLFYVLSGLVYAFKWVDGWLIYNTVDFVEKKEDENGKDTED